MVPAQKFQRPGFGRNPTRAELRRHFQLTHFFGPAYRDHAHAQANLANQQRVEDLHRQIRELKKVLEMKTNADGAQKRLEASSSRFASNARPGTSGAKAGNSKASAGRASRRAPARRFAPSRAPETPANSAKPAKPKPKPKTKPQAPTPLILKIGDEIIYDEGYKSDPIWMPSDANNSA